MIASIKFDVGFKIHLAEMGIFNFLSFGTSTLILLPF
jgi:hypothetical protein